MPAFASDSFDRVDDAPKKRRIVLLEDDPNDALLIIHELTKSGLPADTHWVRDRSGLLAAIEAPPDLVLSDYCLPGYGGMAALADVRAKWPSVPFIVISGALGDEAAAACIKSGVTDYLLKDRLGRLPTAVSKSIEEGRWRAEREAAEERLRQSQKMEAVGRLAGGIAHDFNNVLTAINGWVELLLAGEPLPERAANVVREIGAAGERAARLTQQLLLFGRQRVPQRQRLDLNALVRRLAEMLGRALGPAAELGLDLAERLPSIEADAGMLEQAVVNLAINAGDAMPGGGRVTIETAAAVFRPDARRGLRPLGEFVRLTVRDRGCGIPPEIQPRIFEPFFTTKEPGRGSGMGLSTVFGIVQQHQGWIEVESRMGEGTAFDIYFPVAEAAKPAVYPETRAVPTPPGRETVLVVEDESVVRNLVMSALGRIGYRVIGAENGRRALEEWKRHRAEIDLLMTDVVMPGGPDGLELADLLRTESPDLPVLLTSGYHEQVARSGYAASPATQFLHKPYAMGKLLATVRQLLDNAGKCRAAGRR
ncbi:MAG: response regulator [Opitutaceae bacterium]